MKPWYEALFENYAVNYDKESFTQGTLGEVDFIEQEIGFDKAKQILDIGCGTGRHSIELAQRGYAVTGIDLSAAQLARAGEKAEKLGVTVAFSQQDARVFTPPQDFELVIMLCEGGFSLMETDEMNFTILKNAQKALKPGGKIIFSCLNALYPLNRFLNAALQGVPDPIEPAISSFDIMTFMGGSHFSIKDDAGREMTLNTMERYYAPSEIKWYLQSLNFADIHIGGCRLGAFNRSHPLTVDDYELLVIAEKRGSDWQS